LLVVVYCKLVVVCKTGLGGVGLTAVAKRRRRSQQFKKPARRRPIKLRQLGERSMTRALELVALGKMGVTRNVVCLLQL